MFELHVQVADHHGSELKLLLASPFLSRRAEESAFDAAAALAEIPEGERPDRPHFGLSNDVWNPIILQGLRWPELQEPAEAFDR